MATVINYFDGPEEMENVDHAQSLLKELRVFYNSKQLVDVTIEVQPGLDCQPSCHIGIEKLFHCNRNVLSATSPYFRSMFTGGLFESSQEKVTIHGIDVDSMSNIIDYCYSGKVKITEANVQRLYVAANMLQLEYIRHACSDFMTRRLDLSNCAAVLSFADAFDNQELKGKAKSFIGRNFSKFCSRSMDLCELSLGQMTEILSMDSLDVDCEQKVCSVAVGWIEHNMPEKVEDAAEVLKCIRWCLLTKRDQCFLEGLKLQPYVRKHLTGFMEEIAVGSINAASSINRIGMNTKEMILFFGRPNESFTCYDPYSEGICSVASPTMHIGIGLKRSSVETFSACVTPENDLYLVSNLSKRLWMYNHVLNVWEELAERMLVRVGAAVAFLNGCIYILGGRDPLTERRLKEVECYSIQRNQWMCVAPLPHSPGKMQTVTLNGCLYVINKRRILLYEPKKNQWTHAASLKCGKFHRACIFQDQIFCLLDIPVLKAYSPERGEWRRLGDIPMDSNALGYQLVLCSDKLLLLVVALARRHRNRLAVYEYDPPHDTWKSVSSMTGSSFGCTSLSVRMYSVCLSPKRQSFGGEEDEDSGSSADWDFDGLTDMDSDSGSSSSFSDEDW